MFPFWDPFGLFWQLGWILVFPLVVAIALGYVAFERLFPPGTWVRRQLDHLQ